MSAGKESDFAKDQPAIFSITQFGTILPTRLYPVKEKFVVYFFGFVSGQQPNGDQRFFIDVAAAHKSFIGGVHLYNIACRSFTFYLIDLVIKNPRMTVYHPLPNFLSQKNLCHWPKINCNTGLS